MLLSVAGQETDFSGAQLGSAPAITELVFASSASCTNTTGGTAVNSIEIKGQGYGRRSDDVEYVLVSGFDLEVAAMTAGLNSTTVVQGSREGIMNGSRLFEPSALAAMKIDPWVLAAAIPVRSSSGISVIPVGNVEVPLPAAVWLSEGSIQV